MWPFVKKDIKNSYSSDPIAEEKAIEEFYSGFGGITSSGAAVSKRTAMGVSTFYRCVSLIAGTIAGLPCEIYKREANDQRTLALDNPVYKIVHSEPNHLISANTFWKALLFNTLIHGNGYALILRNKRSGAPIGMYWIASEKVTPRWSLDFTRLWYSIKLDNGATKIFDQSDVFHYPLIGWDGLQGTSPLSCMREALGLAQSGEKHNGMYFKQGVGSNIAIEYPQKFTKEQAEFLRETAKNQLAGMDNMHLPLITMGAGKVSKLALTAEDAQLIESRGFQVEDICRFYGIPTHLVSHATKSTSWGKGIEEQTLGFIKFTLRDYLKGLEQEANRKLLSSEQYYCKFNLDSLLRADSKGRAEFYKSALGGTQSPGYMTPNEVRKLENLPPLPDGDELCHMVEKTDEKSKTSEPVQK